MFLTYKKGMVRDGQNPVLFMDMVDLIFQLHQALVPAMLFLLNREGSMFV